MPVLEFVGQSARDPSFIPANSSRLLNTYREPVEGNDATRFVLKPVLGQAVLVNLSAVFQRAMAWVDGTIYSVAGGKLFSIGLEGDKTELADVTDDAQTTIAGNTGSVAICAGGRYYVWDGATLTEPTAGAFSSFGSVETLANYILLTERDGRRIQWSNVADPTTLDGLDFATTESRADKNIRGMAIGGNYWVFKQRSIEIYYPTGLADAAFALVAGGVMDTGLKAFNLVCKARDIAFFVGSDGVAYITAGQGMQAVSTRPVERSIAAENPTHCFYYEDEGHKFCVLRFSDRPAWVFDISTNEWHERSEGARHGAWSAVASAQTSDGIWFVGSDLGDVSYMQSGLVDKGGPLFRRITSRTLRMDGKRFRVAELEFFGAFGAAKFAGVTAYTLALGTGYIGFDGPYAYDFGEIIAQPTMRIRTSRDGGHTFGLEKTRPISPLASYENRVLFRALGQFREFTCEVDLSAEMEVPLYADARMRVA